MKEHTDFQVKWHKMVHKYHFRLLF